MTPTAVPCACGCGFPISRGMYAYVVNGRYYAQGCVQQTTVPADLTPGTQPENVTVLRFEPPPNQPIPPVQAATA